MTREEGIERMRDAARGKPLAGLVAALAMIDRKRKLTEPERLTRAVLIDVVCEKSPAAHAAFEAWAESDASIADAVPAMVAAVAKEGARS